MDNVSRYDRSIAPHHRDSLSLVASRIKPGTTVLDVGCSTGALGKYLAAHGNQCDGLDYDADSVELARPYYRNVWTIDLEKQPVSSILESRRYDTIVCADVLEHLRNHEDVLRHLISHLSPVGTVIVSIPNVAHTGVIASLLAGDFPYRHDGILDDSHVRFFTRKSLLQLLRNTGLVVVHSDNVILPLNNTEFSALDTSLLPENIGNTISRLPDAFTYQFIIESAPSTRAGIAESPCDSIPGEMENIDLFWATGKADFSANQSSRISVPISNAKSVYNFRVPQTITKLRLDPCSRMAVTQLSGLCIRNEAGREVWRWTPAAPKNGEISNASAHVYQASLVIVPENNDPQWQIPIPDEILESLSGCEFVFEHRSIETHDALTLIYELLLQTEAAKLASDFNLVQEISRLNETNFELSRNLSRIVNAGTWKATEPVRTFSRASRRWYRTARSKIRNFFESPV